MAASISNNLDEVMSKVSGFFHSRSTSAGSRTKKKRRGDGEKENASGNVDVEEVASGSEPVFSEEQEDWLSQNITHCMREFGGGILARVDAKCEAVQQEATEAVSKLSDRLDAIETITDEKVAAVSD